MGIIIAEEIKGVNEQKLRDEFPDADDSLLAQMLERLLPDCDKAIHARARAYYTEQGEAGANDLPFVDDDAAVIDYYMNQQGYQDATKRAAVAASDEAKRRIPEIEKEIKNLEGLLEGAEEDQTSKIEKQIREYKAEIVELQKQII